MWFNKHVVAVRVLSKFWKALLLLGPVFHDAGKRSSKPPKVAKSNGKD
jgi:hypothetical protein